MTAHHDTALPITTLLPESAAEPVILFDQHAALRVAIVERGHTMRISAEEWDRPGVYILLDPPAADGSWGCYVGKAPSGIRTRLRDHLRNKDHWRRAVLIQRDTTFGFNSAQVAWLEGRLFDLLVAAEDARPHNSNRPSDETLPAFERAALENSVVPISRILRLIGYDPATADDSGTVSTTTRSTRTSRFVGITLKHVIDAGYLEPGTALESTTGAWPAHAVVNADGTITFAQRNYPTPSASASAVKGGNAANGWDFWVVTETTGKTSLATLRARYLDSHNETATASNPIG
jgi:hypothetical protein